MAIIKQNLSRREKITTVLRILKLNCSTYHALIVSGNFQFLHDRINALALNTNDQFCVDLTNFQSQN